MDCYGNLAPLTKGGQQLVLNFYAFKENRLPFCVKVLYTLYHHLQQPPSQTGVGRSINQHDKKLLKLHQNCHTRVQKGTGHNAGEKQQPR